MTKIEESQSTTAGRGLVIENPAESMTNGGIPRRTIVKEIWNVSEGIRNAKKKRKGKTSVTVREIENGTVRDIGTVNKILGERREIIDTMKSLAETAADHQVMRDMGDVIKSLLGETEIEEMMVRQVAGAKF
jgi:hypothetical protein